MICKICGKILANDDTFHRSKNYDKKIIICEICQKKRYVLDAKMRDALRRIDKTKSIEEYHKKVRKNTLNFLENQINELCYNNSKLAIKIKELSKKYKIA